MKTKAMPSRITEWTFLLFLSLFVLLPIWIVQYPAAADYWNHLLKARIVAEYGNPMLDYRKYYQIVLLPIPNATSTLVMALLMKIVSPMIAGKMFLSLYAILLAFSSRYLVRAARVPFRALEYIGFAVIYNPCIWDGYVDSCLSVAIAQFAIGYWLKTRDNASPGVAFIYLLLVILTYFTHLWGVVVLLGVVFMLSITESRMRKLIWLISFIVVGLMLLVYSQGTSERLSIYYYGITYTLSLARNFLSLPRLAGLPLDSEHFVSAAVLIVIRIVLLGSLLLMAWKSKTRMFWIALVLLISFFLLPNQLGRMREPGQRTLIFVPTMLAAAIMVKPDRRRSRELSGLMLVCIVLTLVFTARAWIAKDRDLQQYQQALVAIPAHHSVLNVVTLKSRNLSWPLKILGSDMYRSEGFFGSVYNLEKGGLYLHVFTTGIVKVRDNVCPIRPWFMMNDGFEWSQWLKANRSVICHSFEYIVVVGPALQADTVLFPDYRLYWKKGRVELLKRRNEIIKYNNNRYSR